MSCNSFRPNPMNVNDICRNCFQHKDTHQSLEPYSEEKRYRMKIENILYFSDTKEQSAEVNAYISKLMQNLPPPEEYFKVFNVYSYVRQNLTNPELSELHPEDKMLAIYSGVDLLLLVALPLRRPQVFEKVAKLRKRDPTLVKAEKLEGTHDVIRKLGYTVITQDHYEFPPEVTVAPDQNLIREIVADLQIALEEIKLYNYNQHPCPERFAEGADWAKKTTPILQEISREIQEFAEKVDSLIAGGTQQYNRMPLKNPSVAPLNSTVGPWNPPVGPMNPSVGPMNPSVGPMNPSVGPMNPSVGPMYPSVGHMNPSVGPMYPSVGPMNPSIGPMNPSVGPMNPSVGPLNPSVGPMNPSIGPMNPSVGPMNPPVGPMNPPVGPMYPSVGPRNPSVGPMNPSVGPMNPSVGPRNPSGPLNPDYNLSLPAPTQPGTAILGERPGRSRIDTHKDIPPPIPEGMVLCPDVNCKSLVPKNSFVCPKCRMYLSPAPLTEKEAEPPTLIPIETWNCTICTLINTTAQGRTRVCSACDKINPTNVSEVSPTASLDQQPQQNPRKYSNPEDLAPRPHITPSRSLEKHPFEQETEPQYIQPTNPPEDYFPGNYPLYANINQPANPQEYTEYPQNPHIYGQLDQSIHGSPSHYAGMNESYYVQRNPSRNHPDPFPDRPAKDPKEHPHLIKHISQAGLELTNQEASLGPRKSTLPQFPSHYGHPHDMGYPPQHKGDPRMYFKPPAFHNQHSHPQPRFPMMPPPAPIAPHKFVKQIIVQNQVFRDEAIQLGIKKNGVHGCVDWLNNQFNNTINILTKDVRTFELCHNVTSKIVEENYIACQGVVPSVPSRIQESRRKKLGELIEALHVSEQRAISALDEENWEVSAATDRVILMQNQQQLDECRPYMWSGAMAIPEKQPEEIDRELWEQLLVLAGNPDEANNKISRKFLCELRIPSLIQLNLLLHLVISDETKKKEPKDLLQAVQEVSDFDAAMKFLNQKCEICCENYTANEMIQMFFCNHMFCKDCVNDNFTHVVRNAAIKKWTCPECGEPDIQQMEDPSDYFGLLSNVVQALCDHEIADLFHQKVNEFYFSKRAEFRWCPHCHSGFLGQEGVKKLRCPQEECNQYLCYICKRKWEPEHEGRSCEEYQQWREANDRDILDKGLAAKLVEEGIECPSCKFKYELARGGCMHFRCTQCPAEFCCGCFQLFKKENCTKFASCVKKGLHAHHPRNCQYFTRDMEIVKMKELLEKGGFQRDEAVRLEPAPEPGPDGAQAIPVARKRPQIYKVKVPDEHRNAVIEEMTAKMGDQFVEPPQGELKIPCQIAEYKENPNGDFEKENCSKSSLEKDGYAGLCDKHYKEYLCGLITKAGLDPIDVLEVTEDTIFELFAILKRSEVPYDEKMKGDQLKLFIKEKLPLIPINFTGALQA